MREPQKQYPNSGFETDNEFHQVRRTLFLQFEFSLTSRVTYKVDPCIHQWNFDKMLLQIIYADIM